jgi:hypothetical protein
MCAHEVFVMTRIETGSTGESSGDRDRSEYQKQYYLDRKEAISKERKRRYREDPEYRESILDRVSDYRNKKQENINKLRAEGKLPPSHPRGPRPPMKVKVNGVSTIVYTVGRMAVELNRSKDVINYWTRIGLLPPTPYRSASGDRLYTESMAIVVKIAVGKRGRVSASDREFTREIRQGWEGLGVVIPVHVDKTFIRR